MTSRMGPNSKHFVELKDCNLILNVHLHHRLLPSLLIKLTKSEWRLFLLLPTPLHLPRLHRSRHRRSNRCSHHRILPLQGVRLRDLQYPEGIMLARLRSSGVSRCKDEAFVGEFAGGDNGQKAFFDAFTAMMQKLSVLGVKAGSHGRQIPFDSTSFTLIS